MFGGSRHAIAQPIRLGPGAEPYQAASVRPNPLFETSTDDVRTSPQVRTAAALAAAMVGYGFVRSGGAAAGSGSGGGASLRSAVVAGAVATAAPAAAPVDASPCVLSYTDRGKRLHQLYYEIEELKNRSERVMQTARAIMAVLEKSREVMAADTSMPLRLAALEAARALGMDDPDGMADAAVEVAALTADGASPAAAATAAAVTVVAAKDATAAAAAAAAADAAEKASGSGLVSAPPRPASPGAEAAAAAWTPRVSDTVVPADAVPPAAFPATAPLPVPPGNGRVTPSNAPPSSADLAAWANKELQAAAAPPPPPATESSTAPAPPPAPYDKTAYENPVAEQLRPSFKPTRRVTGTPKRAPRTFRAIAPPPPSRVNPSFDVPEDSPSPEEYLAAADGRTADGRINPSFAPAGAAATVDAVVADPPAASAAAPEEYLAAADGRTADGRVNPSFAPAAAADADAAVVAPAGAAADAAQAPEPVWYNPLSWFTLSVSREGERAGAHPSFDSSLAVVEEEAAVVAEKAAEVVGEATEVVEEAAAVVAQATAVVEEAAAAAAAVAESPVELLTSPTEPLASTAAAVAEELEQRVHEQQPEAAESRVESVLRAAERQAESTGEEPGVGTAAAASSAGWSAALLTGAPLTGGVAPVEQVAELLQFATRTEEFTYPKYDPLRNALADVSAPTVEHKYDMLRGLLRAGREEEAATERAARKYDLIYDLLQSVRTSGDPDAILAAGDPKYDPVWSLLNMRAPAPGSLTKYDMVGALLQAALAASPRSNKYDPLQAVLQAEPITGSYKYCIVEALLHGGWQRSLESGLSDLPSWDPVSTLVEAAGASRAPPAQAGGRRAVSKYDMVGQALEAVASLPEDLASGKWAASQGRELLLDTVERTMNEGGWGTWHRLRNGSAVAIGAVASAASTVGNAVSKAMGMPYEVAPGVVVVQEGPRSPARGVTAAGAVSAPPSAASSAEVEVEAERSGEVAEEQPTVVFQFREVKKSKKAESSRGGAAAAPVGKKRFRGIDVGPAATGATPAAAASPAAVAAAAAPAEPVAAPRLERAVVPPLRGTGRRASTATQQQQQPGAMPELPFVDNAALHAAIVESMQSLDDLVAPAAVEPPAAAAAPDAAAVAPATTAADTAAAVVEEEAPALTAEPEPVAHPAVAAAQEDAAAADAAAAAAVAAAAEPPAAVPSDGALLELAVDLLVFMSVQGTKGGDPPGMGELEARFGGTFAGAAAQLRELSADARLMGRHAAVAGAMRAASEARRIGKGLWSHLYDMPNVVRDAEAVMPAFLEDCRSAYPLVQALLATGDAAHSVSVLCSLCNMVPVGEVDANQA